MKLVISFIVILFTTSLWAQSSSRLLENLSKDKKNYIKKQLKSKDKSKKPRKKFPRSLHKVGVKNYQGTVLNMGRYRGKVVLIVNTASKDQYVHQMDTLEQLYRKYKNNGLVVLVAPSNDFGKEPLSAKGFHRHMKKEYNISFPVLEKMWVTGRKKHILYRFLTEYGTRKGEVAWNFEKFLINIKGKVVSRYPATVSPDAPELEKKLKELLEEEEEEDDFE